MAYYSKESRICADPCCQAKKEQILQSASATNSARFVCLTFQVVDHLIVGRSAASPRHDVVLVRLEGREG